MGKTPEQLQLSYEILTTKADEILQQLSLEEKVAICGAQDWWRTVSIRRGDSVLVPHLKMTDGPNGARGESFARGVKAACFPCAESTAASFNTQIAHDIGRAVAVEAQTKSSDVLPAPTVCPVRSPLGGRNHETFGEDPYVLGTIGAAYHTDVGASCQSVGVAATPKHFVANEVEHRRRFVSAEIEERALREIYLYPFQIILKLSDPWCWMTSYNRLNGTYTSEHPHILQDVLRNEWGFQGLVMSDWVGTYSTVEAMNAGLDLEMPAPIYFRGEKLLDAIKEGKVSEKILNDRARKVIELVLRSGRMQCPEDQKEIYSENPDRDELIARASTEGIVPLKNQDNVLPLKKGARVAVIGQPAADMPIFGGGSAKVAVGHILTPIEGLAAAGVDFPYEPGVPVYGAVPVPPLKLLSQTGNQAAPGDVENPVRIEWYNGSVPGTNLVHDEMVDSTEYLIKERWPTYLDEDYCSRMSFDITPETSGPHIFSVITTGAAKLYVDGKLVYNHKQAPVLQRETMYFFRAKVEKKVSYNMEAKKRYTITYETWATPPHIVKASVGGDVVQGSAVGFIEHVDIPTRIRDAAKSAASHDVAIVFTGTTAKFESEGYDRATMDLTPDEYELVLAVAAANPNTVMVNFSGSPVTLTQVYDEVAGLVQAWFPGQGGTSITRILTGEVNPSGCLPVTWPCRVEDNPAHGNWPGDDKDVIHYKEGIFVGYRHYEKHEVKPLFPFGFGLSYTSFEISKLEITTRAVIGKDSSLGVSCDVSNTGAVAGKIVVQFYTRRLALENGGTSDSKFDRPVKELKAYQKPHLEPGASARIEVKLDKYAVSLYDAASASWRAEEGKYEVLAGFSSENIVMGAVFEVTTDFTWTGL
ncbi:hypothetical protein GQ53DRAFT_865657 [Thozetella sp. PMI_491]|nr:hypothetical protein GQ53DRAFT_865657 [Thozetella sp. PMI_491]